MNQISRRMVVTAAICGALGVAIGAFGAHGLQSYLTSLGGDADLVQRRLDQFDTGARYHLVHSVALLALAGIGFDSPKLLRWVARLFLVGIVLFSGSLYLLVITGQTKLGMVTPLGGLSWIIGWCLLAVAALKASPAKE
ncbi:hypothetical protein LF1_22200 [Rubripirellula obstinata]|uniref:DUF423 domain-containing protein n=1 Tax=Rubripirellula obstinata TaxID=406547 RepID=A0A5B1CIA4_9BACT|nr:DUF423 domain-containing protein [Rubripirellula obstinata]KAA1259685.1 hypothetical protein LF1_22200 [Rubripirellula obstinata]